MVPSVVYLLTMGWLWGAKKDSDVSSETKSSGSSKEMPAVPKDEPTSSPEVDPDVISRFVATSVRI